MTATTIAGADKLAQGVGNAADVLAKHWLGGDRGHSIESAAVRRVEYAAGIAATVVVRVTEKIFAGQKSWRGSDGYDDPHEALASVRSQAESVRDPAFFHRHAATLAAPAKFRSLLGGGEQTLLLEGETVKAHSAVHCSGCGGRGRNECRHCRGDGDMVCTNGCGWDNMVACNGCHGSGTNVDTRGNHARCWKCNGRAKMACPGCNGSGRRTCMGCNGAGSFRCRPCGASGIVTHAFGVEVVGHVAPHVVLGDGTEPMERRVRDWIADGMPDAVPVGTGTIMPEVSDVVGPEADGSPAKGSLRLLMGVEGRLVRTDVEGRVGDMPFRGVGWFLATVGCAFAPFLDEAVSELADACGRAAAGGRPSEVAKAAGPGAGMAALLDDASERRRTAEEIGAAGVSGSMGAVTSATIAKVVDASRSASLDYSSIAVRAAWLRVVPVATVAVVAATFAGFDGMLRDADFTPVGIAVACMAAAAAVALVSKGIVRAMAGADLRREAGKAARLPNIRLSRTAGLGIWAGWTGILALPQIATATIAWIAA